MTPTRLLAEKPSERYSKLPSHFVKLDVNALVYIDELHAEAMRNRAALEFVEKLARVWAGEEGWVKADCEKAARTLLESLKGPHTNPQGLKVRTLAEAGIAGSKMPDGAGYEPHIGDNDSWTDPDISGATGSGREIHAKPQPEKAWPDDVVKVWQDDCTPPCQWIKRDGKQIVFRKLDNDKKESFTIWEEEDMAKNVASGDCRVIYTRPQPPSPSADGGEVAREWAEKIVAERDPLAEAKEFCKGFKFDVPCHTHGTSGGVCRECFAFSHHWFAANKTDALKSQVARLEAELAEMKRKVLPSGMLQHGPAFFKVLEPGSPAPGIGTPMGIVIACDPPREAAT